ncbi:hypothetical protein [Planctomycetes bacterium CA13]|uniref:hypothetical protein n=1 Tax=Novipirellula herctigrandis TaxID=2527986 RepID=UPI0011B43926
MQQRTPTDLPTLAASVRDASVVIRTSSAGEPPIELESVSVSMELLRQQNQSVLHVEPATLFDHQRITPELCEHGLQLIAPLLADQISTEGEFSLRLEKCDIPLHSDNQPNAASAQARGELQLHRANAGLKNTIIGKIIS